MKTPEEFAEELLNPFAPNRFDTAAIAKLVRERDAAIREEMTGEAARERVARALYALHLGGTGSVWSDATEEAWDDEPTAVVASFYRKAEAILSALSGGGEKGEPASPAACATCPRCGHVLPLTKFGVCEPCSTTPIGGVAGES